MLIFEISTPKYLCIPDFSVTRSVELEKSAFSDFQWRPSWISKWPPTRWSYRLEMSIFEISVRKYIYAPNFSVTRSVELEKSAYSDFRWRPFWISKWPPTRWSDRVWLAIFEISA